ncbi:NAD-P-binding protein [Auriscalpium vulgare]|uniref:NAD-P-binding protein n=1 Tax=Auriscalpium vulgare TaxID=40419 RepID=A0ACB8RHC5_9AGAM|nr:NAD-P-binding protein [Auriscalpium vulgare]
MAVRPDSTIISRIAHSPTIMSLVVVTGASGFLGSNVVDQLLDAGYKVRGVARGRTAPKVAEKYASFGDKFEIVVADDLTHSDLSHVFKGADALIHVASPIGESNAEITLNSAINGTTRVLEAAYAGGIKKIVVTSSVVALCDPPKLFQKVTLGDKDFGTATYEEALKPENAGFPVYAASKALAEKALWKFVGEHPDLDVATVLPPYLYGKPGRGQNITSPASGTNEQLYVLIKGEKGRPLPPWIPPQFVNVRDVARAHVLALKAPPSDTPKRIILYAGDIPYKAATEYLLETRPELKDRLPVISGDEPADPPYSDFDTSSAERIIGLTEYIGWKQTLDEAIDSFLEKEKELGVSV